jgi:orotidine-5'-phosphate decarboxylase
MIRIPDKQAKDYLCVALDVSNWASLERYVDILAPYVGCFKIGLEVINALGGKDVAKEICRRGGKVFYDIKLHDIPTTVGKAAHVIDGMIGVEYYNVHASAGRAAMQAAAQHQDKAMCLAVTVLTSLTDRDTNGIYGQDASNQAISFAYRAKEAGLPGIICSPQELPILQKEKDLKHLWKVVPGVRPLWANKDDQARVMTPYEAIMNGADMIVMGRPILHPPEGIGTPVMAAQLILQEITMAIRSAE